MLTTPHPVWPRGAPAQPVGARERSVKTSWDTSQTTSASVSVTHFTTKRDILTQVFGLVVVYIELFGNRI